jgi:hypothetical protein
LNKHIKSLILRSQAGRDQHRVCHRKTADGFGDGG